MEQTVDEVSRLQGCINDLISVLALPAMWTGQESTQIVSTLLDVLIGMLRLDFAYARLKDQTLGTPDYVKALDEFKNEIIKLRNVARARASGGNVVGAANASPLDQAVNKATSAGPLEDARAAIAAGAPRDAVLQRLQQNGIDPAGL